jgi:hypothetical protein
MARLVIINGPEAGGELPLHPGVNWLGRAGINDLVLTDPGISGRHCQFVLGTGSLRVRDLGSTNGTFLDGQPVLETELADGQILSLGGLQLRVDNPPVEISIPVITQPEPPRPRFLADGTPACESHEGVVATRRCVQCGRTFCEECLHQLRLTGSTAARVFCPVCSGQCHLIQAPPPPHASTKFVHRLRATLRLTFNFKPGPPKR